MPGPGSRVGQMQSDPRKLRQAVAQTRAILKTNLTPKELQQIVVQDDGAIVGAPKVVKKAIKLLAGADKKQK